MTAIIGRPSVEVVFGENTSAAFAAAGIAEAAADRAEASMEQVAGANLYDSAAKRINRYVDSGTGNIATATGWICSDFMPVEAGKPYTVSDADGRATTIGFFSSESDTGASTGVFPGIAGTRTVTAPPGSIFMAITVKSSIQTEPAWTMVNRGAEALPWEPYGLVTTLKPSALPISTAELQAGLIADVVAYVPESANLYNGAAKREGYYVTNATGVISAAVGWACSGFIPVEAGRSYTVSAAGPRPSAIGFYSSASDSAAVGVSTGSTGTRTVTAPPGANFMAFTVKSTTIAEPDDIMANEGSAALPWEAWSAAQRMVVMKDAVYDPDASADPDDGTFGKLVLVGSGPNESYVESNRSGHLIRNTFVAFPALQLLNYPCRFNLRKQLLDGVQIRDGADDIAPDHLAATFPIGGNHGYIMWVCTVTGHGKTTADEGSVWASGGNEFVLVDVPNINTLCLVARTGTTPPPLAAYTHVSGAAATSGFTVTARSDEQWYPPYGHYSIKCFVDGVETGSQDGEWTFDNDVLFVETSDILAQQTIVDWWVANGGTSGGLIPGGDPLYRMVTAYRFDRDGQLTIHSTWLFAGDVPMADLQGLQVGRDGVNPPDLYRIPGAEPFTYDGNTVDFGQGVASNITIAPDVRITFDDTNLQVAGEYAHRAYSLWNDYIFAVGLLPIGDAAYDVRRARTSNFALTIRPDTAKLYFRVLDKGEFTATAGERYDAIGFRHILPRDGAGPVVCAVRPYDHKAIVYIDWVDFAGMSTATIPADLAGREARVLDSRNAELLGGTLSGPEITAIVDAAGNHGYLVLELVD